MHLRMHPHVKSGFSISSFSSAVAFHELLFLWELALKITPPFKTVTDRLLPFAADQFSKYGTGVHEKLCIGDTAALISKDGKR